MDSQSHRVTILDEWWKKVNIGVAWTSYAFILVQHFETDFVEYQELPRIENGFLSLKGTVKNGAVFQSRIEPLVIVTYEELPPTMLTLGQLGRVRSYSGDSRNAIGCDRANRCSDERDYRLTCTALHRA